jgi:dTDP-4-dehydrorhamnose reductase
MKPAPRIMVTGAEGQLGRALCRQLGEQAIPCNRRSLDVTDVDQVRSMLDQLRPAAIINCAAYTNVDLAETQPDLCWAINAHAVAKLAGECERTGATLVQVSTDYVFGADSLRTTPYSENDRPGPQSVYAQSKLEGEQNAALCQRHFVVRTCGLFGLTARRSNFVETMLRLANEGSLLRVVNDQKCTPSYASHLAAAVLFLLQTAEYGAYHIVNQGETTWFTFACEILRQAGIDIDVEPITTEQLGAPAPRPRYSVLDTGKYQALGGPELPRWEVALAEYLAGREASYDS